MNKKIITISGYSGSGKSTLISQIEKEYNIGIIKFGTVHKKCVKDSGYSYAKDWIKEKGFEPYHNQLLLYFRDELISRIGKENEILVIDGMFSDKCFSYIKNIDSIKLTNIVLDAHYEVRIRRMMERENIDYNTAVQHLYTTDCIKEHAGLSNIIKQYDYIINANLSRENIKNKCIEILKEVKCIDKNVIVEKE